MSVFNVKNSQKPQRHLKANLFLDPDGGVDVARYDRVKYPEIEKITQKMISFFWVPEEIDINKDREDFKKLTEHGQHIFTANLKRQILLDSVQGRSPNLAFLPICSNPELESAIETWSFFEQIHSRSYTHIIRNIYNDPSVVFDEMTTIPEITECADDISYYYDRLIDAIIAYQQGSNTMPAYEVKKRLWLAMLSVNALEGLRFYVSFACSWAFAETKMMEGNAKIIKLISRDENCVVEGTEVLTVNGWKDFKDLQDGEKVAQYHKDGSIDFVVPNAVIRKEYKGPVYNYRNKTSVMQPKIDFSVTPEHRVIWRDSKTGEIRENTAEEFNPSCMKHYVVSGFASGECEDLSDFDRLRIAFQADGSFDDGARTGAHTGKRPVTFSLTKDRKKERMRDLLERLGYDYTEKSSSEKRPDQTCFYVRLPISEYDLLSKDMSDWISLDDKSHMWCNEFMKELSHWDGHLCKGQNDYSDIYYSSTVKANADIVQSIAVLTGRKTIIGVQEDNRKENYKDVWRVRSVERDYVSCGTKPKTKSVEDYDGMVYCVNVPTGMFLTRKNDQVIVTGNCHLGLTQLLIRRLLQEDDSDYDLIREETLDEAVQIYHKTIQQEKDWAKYLFKDGSIMGLNERLLCDYVDYIAAARMKAIKLPVDFDHPKRDPLPWTRNWITSKGSQVAPQETEQTMYVAGGIENDVSTNSLGGLSL